MLTDAGPGTAERMEAARRRVPAKRTRSIAGKSTKPPIIEPSWTQRFTAPLAVLADPSRQVWLATLGGAALTVQGAVAVWGRLVAEGRVVEQAIRERAQLVQQLGRFTASAASRPPNAAD